MKRTPSSERVSTRFPQPFRAVWYNQAVRRTTLPGFGLIFAGIAMLSVAGILIFARSGSDFRAQYWGEEAGTFISEASGIVKVMTDCAEKDDCKIAYIKKDLENAPFGMFFIDCDDSACAQRKEPTYIDSFDTLPTLLAMDCPIGERCQIAKIEGTEFSLMDCRNGVCDIPVSTSVTLKGNATSMSMDCPSVGQCRIAISYLKQLRYIMCQHGLCYVSEDFPQAYGRNPNISCTSDEICSLSYEGLGSEALGEESPTFMFCSDSFCTKGGAAFGGSSTYGEISCREANDCKILADASLATKKAFTNCTDKACGSGYSQQLFPFERTATQELICSTPQDCFMFNENAQFAHCNEDCSSKEHVQLSIDSGDRFDLSCAGESCKIAYVNSSNQVYFYACKDTDCSGPEIGVASSSQSSLNCPEILPPPNCTFQCSSTSGCPSCQLICGGPSSAYSSEATSSESPSGPEGEGSSSAHSSSRRSSRASSTTSLVPSCGNIGAVCGANADCCSLICSAGNCAPPVVGGSSSAASSAPASSAQPPAVSSARSSAPASSAPNVQSTQSSRLSSAVSSRRSSAAAANSSVQLFANCRNNGAECTAGTQCCSNICGGGVCRKTALATSSAASVRLAQQTSSAGQNQQRPTQDIPNIPSPQADEPIASGDPPAMTAMNSPACGNGMVNGNEECDDGNLNDMDRCSTQCRLARCGDRVRQGGEQCDDGNNASGDGCSPGCVIEPKLDADRPPARPAGTISSTPTRAVPSSVRTSSAAVAVKPQARPLESDTAAPSVDAPVVVCGDGTREASEECDDGNVFAADGCSPSCTREACGNGRIDPNESCDRGTANGNVPDALCRPDCTLGRCGDGIRDTGEECDDGNRTDGDGCTNRCISVTPSQILPASIFDAPLILQQPMYSGAPEATPFLASAMVAQDPAPSVPETGPGALAFMAAGGAAGYAWFRRRRGL
jgi:cysteine-rich repeat protein